MSEESRARIPLTRARSYAALASAAKADPGALGSHLDTAIVHARAVAHYLKSEYENCRGFKEWFASLWENGLHQFFVDQRNYILKERPVEVHKEVAVGMEEEVACSASLEVKVIRARPRYGRGRKILWEDFVRAIKQAVKRPVGRWMSIRKAAKRRREAAKRSEPVVTMGFYFDKDEWGDRPALELLEEYLDWLEAVVRDAESRFSGGSPEARQQN